MTDFPYPPFSELNCAPDYFLLGAQAIAALREAGWLGVSERAVPQQVNRTLLPYVGVLRRNGGYAASYRKDGRSKYGKRCQTAHEAALDRARLLGRDWIEMRGET